MSMGDTEIEMNFKVGNAAAANNIMREVYRTQTEGLRRTAKESQILGAGLTNLGKQAGTAAASLMSISAATTILSIIDRTVTSIAQNFSRLNKDITALSSLGDNASNLPELRNEVVELSAAANVSTEAMSQMMFDLQSSTGNLSDEVRDNLKEGILDLAKATGGDLVTANSLMVKSWQIAGKEMENVTELTNKLMYTQEYASLRFEDLATRAPELLSAGQAVGVNFNETMASIIGGSLESGDIAKSMTSFRNIVLIMQEAGEKGIKLTGSYTDKLEQLKVLFDKNPMDMQKLFGKENLAVAMNLINAIDTFKKSLEDLEKVTGDESKAKDLIKTRLKDPISRMVEINDLNARLREEAPNLAEAGAAESAGARWKRRGDLGSLAAQVESGAPADSWTATFGHWRGVFGDRDLIARGRRAELKHSRPGALQDVLLEQDFEATKRDKMRNYFYAGGPGGAPPIIADSVNRQAEALKTSTFDLGRAREAYLDPETVQANTKAIEANTKALEATAKTSPGMVKPGGAKTNYEE